MVQEESATIMLVKRSGGLADILIDMIDNLASYLAWEQKMNDGKLKAGLHELDDVNSKWEGLFDYTDLS